MFRAKSGHEVAKYGDRVYEWRRIVTVAVQAAHDGAPLDGPVAVSMLFELERPRSHFSTARGRELELRPSAPAYPAVAPDVDKLVRGVCDAITDAGNVWADDAQVVRISASKVYVDAGSVPGVTVRVCRVTT